MRIPFKNMIIGSVALYFIKRLFTGSNGEHKVSPLKVKAHRSAGHPSAKKPHKKAKN